MRKLFFVYVMFFCCGTLYCADFLSTRLCEATRTTPYFFLGTSIDIELPDSHGILHNLGGCEKSSFVCFLKGSMVSERSLLLSYFSQLYPWFQKMGIELFCITTGPVVADEYMPLPFPLLFDYTQNISKKYCTDSASQFGSAHTTFIVDERGVITQVLNMQDIGELVAQLVIHVLSLGKNVTSTCTYKSFPECVERSLVPEIELTDSSGNLVHLSDYRGSWVLLAFADSIRNVYEYERFLYLLNDTYSWLRQHKILVICACTKSVDELARFQKYSGLQYPLLSDERRTIPEKFGEPWAFYHEFISYLIDPSGNRVTSFISESADLLFARLCRYIITHETGRDA
ncbi:MAG: redoxin domain-containing protein [Candidatus Dependentiae bacterium]|nr:redoxin domain-containing protein [Candidatus Dependentiae bacterium]